MTKLTRKEILAQLDGVEKRCESLTTDVINARGESAKQLLSLTETRKQLAEKTAQLEALTQEYEASQSDLVNSRTYIIGLLKNQMTTANTRQWRKYEAQQNPN